MHFLATGLQSYTFDVSDVARKERKLSEIKAIGQASKSCFLYHSTLREDNFFHWSKRNWDFVFRFFFYMG